MIEGRHRPEAGPLLRKVGRAKADLAWYLYRSGSMLNDEQAHYVKVRIRILNQFGRW